MQTSWVWELEFKDGKIKLLLCETPTRYEALSGIVSWMYSRSIPGTFGICNYLIGWLDNKVVTKYEIEIPEEALKYLDDYYEDDNEWPEKDKERA